MNTGATMRYSIWGRGGIADTLVGGEQQPAFVDGSACDPDHKLIGAFDAEDFEAAIRRFDEVRAMTAELAGAMDATIIKLEHAGKTELLAIARQVRALMIGVDKTIEAETNGGISTEAANPKSV